MNIFDFDSYKAWVKSAIVAMPKGGRGQLKRIADHLGTSPTVITQVFNGERELTPEQAILLADYFALAKAETRFLLALVNLARAGSHRYRLALKEEIDELRTSGREISSRVPQNAALSEEAKSVFYSNWYYAAVWALVAIDPRSEPPSLADRLGLPLRRAREALDFLLKHGLLISQPDGALSPGPTLVHLESGSPQLPRHHQNWRLQAFRHYENPAAEDLFYTAPVSLSSADVKEIRKRVLSLIGEAVNRIKDSNSEKLYCLNIDWFEV